jgi:hypothetical protein
MLVYTGNALETGTCVTKLVRHCEYCSEYDFIRDPYKDWREIQKFQRFLTSDVVFEGSSASVQTIQQSLSKESPLKLKNKLISPLRM